MSANGSEHWLIYPITLLCLCITAALLLHPGWLTVILSLLVAAVGAGQSLLRREPWMLADHITTTRLGLIIVWCALVADQTGFSWPAVLVGAVALALDAADGVAARKTGSTHAGAAYDEAVDALTILLLGIGLTPLWGTWTIIPGLLFYVFHAIAAFRPTWRYPLPPSRRRKSISAAQGVLLLTAGAPLAQAWSWVGPSCIGIALSLVIYSFATDVYWLERRIC